MKKKVLVGVITLTMIFALFSGCGKNSIDTSDSNMIYGEVMKIDDGSITVKLGTLSMEQKESESIISYTGKTETYKLAENVVARSQDVMGYGKGNVGEAPTDENGETMARPEDNMGEAPTDENGETMARPEGNMGEVPTDVNGETMARPEGNVGEAPTDENGETMARPEGNVGEAPTDENGETMARPEGNMGEAPTDENGETMARPEGKNGGDDFSQMAKKIELSDIQVGNIVAITLDENGKVKDILVYSVNNMEMKKEEHDEESL